MFQADDPTSPLFIGLLFAALLDMVYIYTGLFRGRLPNMRTSIRAARFASIFFIASLAGVFASYYLYTYSGELRGSLALIFAGVMFIAGILLAERIPD